MVDVKMRRADRKMAIVEMAAAAGKRGIGTGNVVTEFGISRQLADGLLKELVAEGRLKSQRVEDVGTALGYRNVYTIAG